MILGDIHWVDLPNQGGREQFGRRPAIIWQDNAAFPHLPTVLVLPLTSRLSAQRFAATCLIQPSTQNGLTLPSVALVFQLGAIDVRRIDGRVGSLDVNDLTVRDLARRLQRL